MSIHLDRHSCIEISQSLGPDRQTTNRRDLTIDVSNKSLSASIQSFINETKLAGLLRNLILTMSPLPASYGSMSTSSSVSSFDISEFLVGVESCVLSESLTLESLSTASSDTTPPFPSGCMLPMSTILGLGNHLSIFPQGLPHIGGFSEVDELSKSKLAAPTPPRLRTMLKECLCVRKWVVRLHPTKASSSTDTSSKENLVVSDAPGHTPWGGIEDSPPTAWIPEGSIYPPEAFREAISNARHTHQVKSCGEVYHALAASVPTLPSNSARRASYHPTSFRKALVFEHEITLNSDGKTKRWSLQVPAATMNPEMVDMMLELQDLNSFFRDGLEDLDHSVAVLSKEKDRLNLPSLVVSNSDFALPISLESSGNLSPGVPLALAARRGKKMLPPLSFRQDFDDNPYPSMPTAFLGSPSSYSPKFEFANRSDEPSMDPENMIASLRSQYTSILRSSHVADIFEAKQAGEPRNASNFRSVDDIYDGEWSFAHGLMTEHGGSAFVIDSAKLATANPVHHSVVQSVSFNADSPASTPDTSAESIDTGITDIVQPYYPQSNWAVPITSQPPSTPLPPCPSPTSPSSLQREVRGILKSCKSVRFASLPSRHEAPPVVVKPHVRAPRHSTGAPSITPLRRPSPLRNTYTPKSTTTLPLAMALAPPNSQPRLSVPPANTITSLSAGKQRRSTFGVSSRPVSSPTPASAPSLMKEVPNHTLIRSPLRRSTPKQRVLAVQGSARHTSSLGRCSLGCPSAGKENRSRTCYPPAVFDCEGEQ